MTHTPGPWNYANVYGYWAVYGKDNQEIALIAKTTHDDETVEADARLIAAAPEMKDILVLLSVAQNGRDYDAAYTIGDYHEDIAAAANLARIVLDKVRGENTTE